MLVMVMACLLIVVGFTLGEVLSRGAGAFGMFIAFMVWVGLSLASYFSGDRIVLAMSGARRIEKSDHPQLFNIVEEMQIASGLPRPPEVYIIDEAAPNAFATGRKPETSAVAVTAGLLERLDRDELQGVIAHEIGHIKNRDVLFMTMVGVMLGAIVYLSDTGLRGMFHGHRTRRRTSSDNGQGNAIMLIIAIIVFILAPIIAQLIYYAVSRKREYLADASAVQFTRYPDGLARALEKISISPFKLNAANRATAGMYIVNPLKWTAQGLADLSSTHPATTERVKILRSMAGGAGFVDYDRAFKRITGQKGGVMPKSALALGAMAAVSPHTQVAPVSASAPATTPAMAVAERVRQTTDVLWKVNKYIFINCDCDTKLKIPPIYANKLIECPHCRKAHKVTV